MSRKRWLAHQLAPVNHLRRVIRRERTSALGVGLHEGFGPRAPLRAVRVERLFGHGFRRTRLVILFHVFLSFRGQLTDYSFLYQTHSTYMTGNELVEQARCAISLREEAFTEGEYLRRDVEVRRVQRCIDRMRLEVYVRVGDKQLMLADVLDLRDSCVRLNMPGDVNYLNALIEQAMKIEFEP